MDIPDPISFLNRFGTNQRSVVKVISRQSMPKNHVFIQNHKVPFSKQATFNSFQNQSNMPISTLLFEIIQNVPKSTTSHPQLTHWHFTKIPKTTSNHFNTSQLMAKGQTQSYILLIPISNNINFQINHHYTWSTSYSPSTWYHPSIQPQSSIKHISQHAFLIYHTIKASIFIITYMNTSYISTIQQHQQFNAYLRASSLSISYHITY